MDSENKSIHEFDVNLICEYFLGMERQGPGRHYLTLNDVPFKLYNDSYGNIFFWDTHLGVSEKCCRLINRCKIPPAKFAKN
jgi:hypothetical protein